jgi:bifunctional enzyme CysN/CysC
MCTAEGEVNRQARAALKGQRPCIVWLTGRSGSGKSTIARLVEQRLHGAGRHTYLLDGDCIRRSLNRDLGFSIADREENVRRIAELSRLMVDAGLIVLVSMISPFKAGRAAARILNRDVEFFEIYVDAPPEIAEARDPKGLYAKVRAGLLQDFTGIDSPYEPPERPDLHIETAHTDPSSAAERILAMLRRSQSVEER